MNVPVFAKKRRLLVLAVAAAALACAGYLGFAPASSADYTPYRDFYALVESGSIEKARIEGSRIYFQEKASEQDSVAEHSAKTFPRYTDNPYSPGLYEKLLLHGVEVKLSSDGGEIFSHILDALFYVLFFGAVILVFRKFISPNTFKVVRRTGVSFDDVIGMDNLKSYMKQVMDIMRQPAEYAKKGVRAPKGVILEGAPGNGKTLFARALAGEAKVNFIPAKATDFESMFMAIGPMKVKLLFRKARRRAPCIVFIDEFDGIGTRRNYSGSAIETENTRIVTALLNELDGFEANSGILVLAATNSIAALDPALIRPGRFDLRVQVPYPDAAAREKLVLLYLKGKAYEADGGEDAFVSALVKRFDGASAAEIESSLNDAVLTAAQAGRSAFCFQDVKFFGR
ncbi:MAG: AAA family ATPase [Treponema sp.]|nr:AAA family ATPase [Treponema sp.]